LKIGIVASDRSEWHVKGLLSELKKRDFESYLLPVTKFRSKIGLDPKISVGGYGLEDYDAVIVRRVPGGSVEQVIYRMDALFRLEELGVKVINTAKSIEKTVDKFMTSALLEDAGIRTPRTIVTESFSEALKAYDELGGDVVVKPLFGSLGLGMTRVDNREVAYRVFRALEMTNSVYYLQEFISHPGEDLRILVIGDSVIASMRRVAKGWKTNISGGGKPEPYTPDEDIIKTSIKSASVLGLLYTGVDIIVSETGVPYVIELNSTPGWEGLQTVSKVDITGALVDHVVSMLR
jgi:RimK family alpha-L-glutamate ligase